MGNITFSMGTASDLNVADGSAGAVFDEFRGVGMQSTLDFHQKDFAIAYDRFVCLRTGSYHFDFRTMTGASSQSGAMRLQIHINGVDTQAAYLVDADHYNANVTFDVDLIRGDYFHVTGYLRDGIWGSYQVIRVK